MVKIRDGHFGRSIAEVDHKAGNFHQIRWPGSAGRLTTQVLDGSFHISGTKIVGALCRLSAEGTLWLRAVRHTRPSELKMISEKYRCIFIHIPKTAGQSIEQFFLNLHGLSWEKRDPLLLRYNSDPSRGPDSLAHLTAKEYVDCGYLTATEFDKYFKFSFVRNPWERLVSEYCYRQYYKKYSFREFVLNGLPTRNRYSDSYRHIMPQSEFILDENGQPLVDFIGRFENLQSDFEAVCAKLSIDGAMLPFRNQSDKRKGAMEILRRVLSKDTRHSETSYSSYYDKDLRERVAEMYAADIRAFNYEFELR